ncbi:MAG: sulfate adenylyltransferase [Candidatus Omnitrophica bacterium]|nr:sulfate adenylyltransferase [Candidatus Omnitrophota bacterium]
MILPHGGRLVNRIVAKGTKNSLAKRASGLYKIKISKEHVQELVNIATGLFSPLEGFLSRRDLSSVLNKKRLANGVTWTVPIVLDIPAFIYPEIKKEKKLSLMDDKGIVLALMDVDDVYRYDKRNFAKRLYGTTDTSHPGVDKVFKMGQYLIGGKIKLIDMPEYEFSKYTLTPRETRERFKSLGWERIVAFQTRNVPHMGHEYVQKTALSYVDGLFINPVIGRKKKGDFKDKVIIETYEKLIKNYYQRDHVFLSVLQMEMRYAGPREAIHHAIIRKNFGCTHIIIGRDHAGVGDFYHPFAAHEIFNEFPDLEIKPIFFKSFFWCNHCKGVANDKTCPHKGKDIENFSGTKIRGMLESGKVPSDKLMRPEIAKTILKYKHPFVE